MKKHLVDLEKRAFEFKNSGRLREASCFLEQILEEEPHWEHGYGAYLLAECYEEQGDFGKAQIAYERAVETNPSDPVFAGGYAAFLLLHGDASKAFDSHLRLYSIEIAQGDRNGAASTMIALKELGSRLGLSQEVIEDRIARVQKGSTLES